MKEPKSLWATRINLTGLWDNKPTRVYWDNEIGDYWDHSNEMNVPDEKGYFTAGICSYFVSENKEEVQKFIDDYQEAIGEALNSIEKIETKSEGFAAAKKTLGNLL